MLFSDSLCCFPSNLAVSGYNIMCCDTKVSATVAFPESSCYDALVIEYTFTHSLFMYTDAFLLRAETLFSLYTVRQCRTSLFRGLRRERREACRAVLVLAVAWWQLDEPHWPVHPWSLGAFLPGVDGFALLPRRHLVPP